MSLEYLKQIFPGILVSGLIATAAQSISEHYGAPAMLMALLFGIALNFLSDDAHCAEGIAFSARTILRFGVALLGMRISFQIAAELGWLIIFLVISGVIATMRLWHGSITDFWVSHQVCFLICGVSCNLWCFGCNGHLSNPSKRLQIRGATYFYSR